MAAAQNYKNHQRWDPAWHFFLAPVLLLNVVAIGIWTWRHRAQHWHIGLWAVLVSIALVVMAALIRSYALKNQDRIILLEERLRYAMLLTPELAAQASVQLSRQQIIALRFAGDDELPSMLDRTLREDLDPEAIKKSVSNWRADSPRI
jgi:hypothetical protein